MQQWWVWTGKLNSQLDGRLGSLFVWRWLDEKGQERSKEGLEQSGVR